MNSRATVEFEDADIVREHDDVGLDCPVCGLNAKTRYRLEGERGPATCPRCFVGWLEDNDAEVTLEIDT